jgi:hypothetical protein
MKKPQTTLIKKRANIVRFTEKIKICYNIK